MGFIVRTGIRVPVAGLVFLIASAFAEAATVTYTLEIHQLAGEWQLFGEASLGDNSGLALVSVPLQNVDFPIDLQLPLARWDAINVDVQGFTKFRVDSSSPIGGSQDIAGGTGIVYGFGQTDGSLTDGDAWIQKDYEAKLLLAQGTFNTAGPLPQFGSGGSANVFVSSSGTGVVIADLVKAVAFVPEPGSFATAFIALIGLSCGIRGRRRAMAARVLR